MIKYLGEVLATSDSHKVITSFTGSEFLRNLHLHNRKGLFLMTGLQTRRRMYARTYARTYADSLCVSAPLSSCDSRVLFLSGHSHVVFVTQEIFYYAESNSH